MGTCINNLKTLSVGQPGDLNPQLTAQQFSALHNKLAMLN